MPIAMRPIGAPERLGDFIREHCDDIMATWEAAVRAMPIARELDRPALIDHIPQLLEQIAHIIGELGATEMRSDIADRHALARLDEGFDLAQVVDELGILRDCVMARWTMHEVTSLQLEDLRILNQAIDHAVREAVVMFTQARNRTLQAIDRIVTAAFESRNLDDLLRRLLSVLLETTPAIDTTAILLREGDVLRVRAAVGVERELEEGFTLLIGEGFAGTIAATARSLSLAEASQNPMIKSPILRAAQIRALYGVPLIDNGEVIGVAHMGSRTAPEFSEQDKRLFATMAARATSSIVQHALRDVAEAASADRRFLDEATRILASSLNYHETLEALAALAVPQLADWCVVDLVEDGKPQRVAIAHTDPDKIAVARDWAAKYPADPLANSGLFNVIRTGKPELISEITDDMIDKGAVDAEQALALRALGLRSVMVIPLAARGRTIGALTMVSTRPHRLYRQTDVDRAAELGRRAGLAVDNARLYREAQQAVRVREDILAIVSHDLRNPLGAIDLGASMLLQAHGSEPRSRKQLEIIRRSTDRMEHMISDLLDMASIQAGRLALVLEPQEADPVIAEVFDAHQPIAAEKAIEITSTTEVDGVRILADRDRLVQVFGNLVGNSIKFCRASDRIEISARVAGDEVCFKIHDTGPGIPADDLPHIFEPYWSAQRHAKKGTGLGLYISKGIIEAHHGRIWVESAPGQGTTFFVALPRVTDTAKSA